jgi:hypothetical protein
MRVALVLLLGGAEGSAGEGAFLGVGVAHPSFNFATKFGAKPKKSFEILEIPCYWWIYENGDARMGCDVHGGEERNGEDSQAALDSCAIPTSLPLPHCFRCRRRKTQRRGFGNHGRRADVFSRS